MKKILYKTSLWLLSSTILAGIVHAQLKVDRICFFDEDDKKFLFTNIQTRGTDKYYAEGTYNGYPNGTAIMWLDLTRGRDFGITEIHGINGRPDGCFSYSDSFVLHGTTIVYREGGEAFYLGGGTWQSYCSHHVLVQGTWSGSGPCNNLRRIAANHDLTPTKGSGKIAPKPQELLIKISPNPIKNAAQFEYRVVSAGNVNITVYNYLHQPVKVLTNEYKTAGNYNVTWNVLGANGSRVPAGLYKVVITSGNKITSGTLQVIE